MLKQSDVKIVRTYLRHRPLIRFSVYTVNTRTSVALLYRSSVNFSEISSTSHYFIVISSVFVASVYFCLYVHG